MSSKSKVAQNPSETFEPESEDSIQQETKGNEPQPTKAKAAEPNTQETKKQKSQEPSLADQLKEAQAQIQSLQKKMEEMTDQFLRKNAELDNFRKRLIRDKEEAVKYANSSILTDLIETLDNFERAIEGGKGSNIESFVKGVEMIQSQLLSMLDNKYGLKQMKCVGEEFNPDIHEAISMVVSEDHKDKQVVLQEFQKGYTVADRVLRHAKVVVSKIEE